MDLCLTHIPKDMAIYEHQVAGHGYTQRCESNPKKSKPQLLHSPAERCIYKPVQAAPKGDREIQFYRSVFSSDGRDSADLAELRCLLPSFGGVYRDESGRRYLRLDDLLADFVQPSVMDLKMGARSYEPDASERKRATELAKYRHRESVGFLVTGLRAWREDRQEYEHLGKRHWANITPDRLHTDVMPPFLSSVPRGAHRRRAVRQLLDQLERLLAWFERQTIFHFYASSVLLAVESCRAALDDASSEASSLDDAGSPSLPAVTPVRAPASDDSSTSGVASSQPTVDHLQSSPAQAGGDSLPLPKPQLGALSNDDSSEMATSDHYSPPSRSSVDPLDSETSSRFSNANYRPSIALAAMIDFTHAVPGHGCRDENYLVGLRTLIGLLRDYQFE